MRRRFVEPPLDADWQQLGHVTHIFTHFALEMQVMTARAAGNPQRGFWLPRGEFSAQDLPGLMRKVWKLVE